MERVFQRNMRQLMKSPVLLKPKQKGTEAVHECMNLVYEVVLQHLVSVMELLHE